MGHVGLIDYCIKFDFIKGCVLLEIKIARNVNIQHISCNPL